MQIKTWSNFSKRVNSTKQPLDSAATTKDVTLKDMCDILAPSFILNTTDFDINYVQAFGNYYYAQCINLDGHRTEIKCSLDHLATFKTQIGGYRGFIEYTSSSSDIMITDPRNNPTCEVANAHVSASFDFTTDTTGCYILGVAAKDGVKNGATTWFALSKQGLSDICASIYDSNLWQQMWNQFNGVQNAILSSFWVPFPLSFVSTYFSSNTPGLFYIGDEVVNASDCYNLQNRIHTGADVTITAAFPFSFGGAQTPCYIYKAPYCTATLYLPFVGEVELPVDIAADNPKFIITYQMDILTGDIVYYLKGDEAGLISTYTGNFASKIPVSGSSYDAIGVVKGALTTVVGGIGSLMNPHILGAGAMLAGVGNTVTSLRLNTQSNGSISSALGGLYYPEAKIDVHISLPAESTLDAWKAAHGMPYFKVATISSLSGYIKCSDASVSIPGDGAEQDTVNSYLNAGIYYE